MYKTIFLPVKMPVDKFGLMDDDPSTHITNIQHLRNYAVNLDDLENVEGFDEEGIKDKFYCFKLNEKGVYNRAEVPSNGSPLDSIAIGWIENKSLIFVHHPTLNWIPLSKKYDWDS